MIQNKNRISIVIPVYNEAEHIDDCLRAIAKQVVRPLEVIVVDNNSTDDTAARIAKYSFVTLLKEPRQGVVHARNLGFDAARGDIIGRIDADTLLPSDWTQNLKAIFAGNPRLDAVSGAVSYHDLPFPNFARKIDLLFRQHIANKMAGEVFLYGANMGIRRSAWMKVRGDVCHAKGLHEDFDLAIHSQDLGSIITFDKRLKASVSLRRVDVGAKDFWQYAIQNPLTYSSHGRRSQRHMYPAIGLVLAGFWILKLIHKSYDGRNMSWRKLLINSEARVNPATFVD
jgi:glycosyltransferase involved in cell wall biosynthesis